MILKIKVTKDCIMNGKKADGKKCPIKLSMIDLFPNAFVDVTGIYTDGLYYKDEFGFHQRHTPIPIPKDIEEFIERFDKMSTWKFFILPFEFEIEIPEEIINQINIDELRPLLTNHKNLELV